MAIVWLLDSLLLQSNGCISPKYINDKPQTPDVYLGLFDDYTCIYETDRKDS
jgi:hypothetical protein